MATTQIIRPDADVVGFFDANYGNPSAAPVGQPTRWQAESDSSDASYDDYEGGASLATGEGFSLTTYTLSGSQKCSRMRQVHRLKKQSGNTTSFQSWIHGYPAGVRTWSSPDQQYSVSSTTTYEQQFPWRKPSDMTQGTPPTGPDFSQTEITGLRIEHMHFPGGTGTNYEHRVFESWVELEILEAPAVTWDLSTLTADTNPYTTWKWNYSGNGETQKKYRIKVFTLAQTVAGGFDPDVTTPIYDTGEVTSSAANHSTSTGGASPFTLNGDYKAYIKVAKDLNGTDWWSSAWVITPTYTITENPVTNVTAPTGAAVNSSTPTITWTYADGNSTIVNPQVRYHIKLYRKLSGSWPAGFPGDLSTFDAAVTAGTIVLVYDSGVVVNDASTSKSLSGTGVTLANASNYRTYMRTGKIEADLPIGVSYLMYSAWDFEEFTTSFAQPPVPLISVVRDPVKLTDHLITVTPQAGTPTAEYWNVYRSINNGPYKAFHIGGGQSSLNRVLTGATVFRDAEAPQNQLVTYAAESVDTGLGVPVASNLATASITNTLNQVWLKVPMAPSYDMRLMVEDVWEAVTQVKPRTSHAPLGRNAAIVVKSGTKYDTLSLTFLVLTRASYTALQNLLGQGNVFFLQTPKDIWYVEVSGDISEQAHLWDGLHAEEDVWKFTIPFVEVETDAGV